MGMIQNKVKVSQPVSHIIIENAGGLQGPAGAPGQTGPQGEPGPAGADGKDGTSATVAVGTTTTLPAGSSATVTNTGTSSDAVFNFGIPKGDKGDKGDAGAGLVITGAVATYQDLPTNLTPADAGKAYFVEADGKLYVWSGTQFPAEGEGSQFEGPQGPAGQDGADGQAATITVGSTTTLSPGASATVTNSGTSSAAVFDFGIPQGATGATGPAGPANTLSIGTVEGGDTAAATITGTAPNQTLNLTLPKGDKGDQGDPGPEPEMVRNAKGTTIELTDAGSNIVSLNDMYGDTEQEGTPTPDTPQKVQTVTGEQTITISDGENQTSSYTIDLGQNFWSDLGGTYSRTLGSCVCVTKSNGHITMNGTSGGSNNWTLDSASAVSSGMVVSLEAGTYTMFTDNTTIQKQVIWTNSAGSSEGLLVDSSNSGVSFTLTETKLVYVRARVTANTTYNEDISVEIQKGTTQRTPIELCKIGTYQDYIYKSGNDWYVHKEIKKVVFNGSENWYPEQYGAYYRFGRPISDIVSTAGRNTDGALCDHFMISTENTYGVSYYGSGYIMLWQPNSSITTAAGMKNWLASNITTYYYPLATPTETKITDATLISQLDAVSSAALYEGNTDITVTSSNLAGEIDIDYWTYFHRTVQTNDIADGAITVPKINSLQDLADALRPYLS